MTVASPTSTARPPSLSIVIPAYNEAENIVDTLENCTKALAPLTIRSEILVIDDGSKDQTAALVTKYAETSSSVRLLKNDRNRGFGWSYRRGVEEAELEHIVMVHGDNAWGADTLRDFFGHVGEADIIIGYTRDMLGSRTWTRTIISKTFTFLVNLVTWRHLRYFNGLQIHKAPVLKSLRIESSGYGFQAEVLVKALAMTTTYVEVPMDLIERKKGESKAFRLKNFVDVARSLNTIRRVAWRRNA